MTKYKTCKCKIFFIKDKIKSGESAMVHCHTGNMIADLFTKPLQGALFVRFWGILMGVAESKIVTID